MLTTLGPCVVCCLLTRPGNSSNNVRQEIGKSQKKGGDIHIYLTNNTRFLYCLAHRTHCAVSSTSLPETVS
ncbi:hypothetical protein F5X99DRAFT_197920 [Biscogniauxia marginata]|nr:hypothetical protein F5X99DRAFT_197920 [Biscogniauxia marginata]